MRIAIFQDTFHPKVDGVVVSTNLFREELKRQGHEVLLVVPRHPEDNQTYDDDVCQIPAVDINLLYPGACLGKFWRNEELGPRITAFKPDLIHSMTEFTIGHFMSTHWVNKLRVPRVHTFHTLWNEYIFYLPLIPNGLVRAWMRWAAPRTARKRVKAIISPSEAMSETIRDEWNVGEFPIHAVPTGLQLGKFNHMVGERFRERHGIKAGERVVLYLGRMGDEKNVDLVINTMGELKRRGQGNVRYVVAGGGPPDYLKKMHKLAEKNGVGDDIIWTGFISGQDWLDCYGAADLFLFPSVTETQGLVVIEALAAGVPLVSVKAMGPASTMTGEKGCLWGENDPKDFADKTQQLLGDDELYERKKREALAVAADYAIENRASQLVDVYEEAVSAYALEGQGPHRPPMRALAG